MKAKYALRIVVVLFVAVLVLAAGGESVKLTCTRGEPSQSVNCVKQTSLYWTLKLAEQELREVRGAQVTESYDQDGRIAAYNVDLLTAQGNVELSYVSHNHTPPKEMVDQINTFVGTLTEKTLEIADPGWVMGGGYICLIPLFPLYIIYSIIVIFADPKQASGETGRG